MALLTASPETSTGDSVNHFLVRTELRLDARPPRLSGMVECIASGEKAVFETPEELLRLIVAWSASDCRTPDGRT